MRNFGIVSLAALKNSEGREFDTPAIWDSLEKKVLPRSARQINRASVNEHNNNIMRGELMEEIRKSISAWKKRLCLVVEDDRGHIEHRLK